MREKEKKARDKEKVGKIEKEKVRREVCIQ